MLGFCCLQEAAVAYALALSAWPLCALPAHVPGRAAGRGEVVTRDPTWRSMRGWAVIVLAMWCG